MSSTLPNYLRTYRKKAGFTQKETAFVLGLKSAGRISRYENFSRLPNLKTALAYEAIFRAPVRKLFAGVFELVEKEVIKGASELSKKLEKENLNPALVRKLEILKAITCQKPN